MEASLVVQAGLHLIGAVRPSWEQGQREYTIPREDCAWCAGPNDPGTKGRFCHPNCAKAFLSERSVEALSRDCSIYQSAQRLLRQARKDKRACSHCGKEFMHDGDADPRKLCSRDCYSKFKASSTAEVYTRVCKLCEARFSTSVAGSLFCSNACQVTESRLRTGRNVPKKLTRPIFDYVLTTPVNEFQRRRLTPQKLDWLFLELGLGITGEWFKETALEKQNPAG